MRVGNTDIHIVTFVIILFEIIMLGYQYIFFFMRPKDEMRKYYLILLILLIVKNVAMGLFPDPNIKSIPLTMQYILTYGAGFIMASYFPFYFYKAYDIYQLKWHATKGVFLLIHLPFFLFFSITYLITSDINKAINFGLVIPALYGLVLGYVLLKSIKDRFKDDVKRKDYFEIFGVYCAVIPYASLAFCAYFRIEQVNEALLTNGGFVVITVLFMRKSINSGKQDFIKLQTLEGVGLKNLRFTEIIQERQTSEVGEIISTEKASIDKHNDGFSSTMKFESSMSEYGLTPREREVLRLAKIGLTNEEIGLKLHISKATVKKHLENIFKKVQVTNRVELIHKLENK